MSSGINLGMGPTGGFDANAYLQANPDLQQIVAQFPGFDLRQHYEQYGKAEGRPLSPADAQAKAAAAAAPQGPPPIPKAPTPILGGSGGPDWRNYLQKAHNETAGLNRLPGVAPTADQMPFDPRAAMAMMRGGGPVTAQGAAAAGAAGAATPPGPIMNLGMGDLSGVPTANGQPLDGGRSYYGGNALGGGYAGPQNWPG